MSEAVVCISLYIPLRADTVLRQKDPAGMLRIRPCYTHIGECLHKLNVHVTSQWRHNACNVAMVAIADYVFITRLDPSSPSSRQPAKNRGREPYDLFNTKAC